jgi:hypothetical protein
MAKGLLHGAVDLGDLHRLLMGRSTLTTARWTSP